jgi:hypothetical protein
MASRVERDVDDGELELVRVDLHRPHLGPDRGDQTDRTADGARQHAADRLEALADPKHGRIGRLATREGQELPRQRLAVLRRELDRLRGAPGPRVVGDYPLDRGQVPDHHHQEIVEVVRDAAR